MERIPQRELQNNVYSAIMRPRPLVLMLLVAFLAGCGGSKPAATLTATAPGITRATATQTTASGAGATRGPRVTLTGENHHPKVNGKWSYSVRVTSAAGEPIPAKIHLQVLFAGVPVGQIGVHRVRNGVWKETLGIPGNPPFPPASRGQHLVFQAVVTARGRRVVRNWPIVPR